VTANTFQPIDQQPRKFYYGHIIVGASFIVMCVAFGLYIVYGVFFDPLREEFGWSRAVTSGAYSVSSVFSGVLGILMGKLTDKFGPRLVVLLSGVLLSLGYFLMSRINSEWQLYLFFGVIIGTGMSGIWIPLLSTVARWFERSRSMMTGITISGLTVGQIIGPPVISRLIDKYDWRDTYVMLAITVFVIVVLSALLLKRKPEGIIEPPSKKQEKRAEVKTIPALDYTLAVAARTIQFWLTMAALFCFGFIAYGLTVHLVPHITQLGISNIDAASVLAVSGGIGIIGNFLLGGVLGDRIGNRKAFILGIVLALIGLVVLLFARELWIFYLFAVFFGLGLGAMGTSESPLAARLFGLKNHGLIYGVMGLGFTAGGSAGPVIIGYMGDLAGSYQSAFVVCLVLSLISLACLLMLRPVRKQGPGL
jgi:MFS family permease